MLSYHKHCLIHITLDFDMIFLIVFICLFLAVLGLHCLTFHSGLSLVVANRVYSLVVVHRLTAVASPVEEQRF